MKKIKFLAFWILLAGIALLGATAAAQDEDDPPGRVARMNFSQGSVSFQPGGEGDWVSAVPNRPLTTGDNLWTDRNSRAELHIGSTSVRMGPETSLTFLQLDDRTAQFRLSDGSMILRVRHLDDDDLIEVDTPNAAFSVLKNGEYRIDVDRDGNETYITAWHGRGEVTGGGSSYVVVGGQRARFFGTDSLNYDIADIPRSDDFDDWAFDRDGREDRDDASNYVSQEMTGYEDLDDYGRWRYVIIQIDRKSTRLNSSHLGISYAVFCLKKKKKKTNKKILNKKSTNHKKKKHTPTTQCTRPNTYSSKINTESDVIYHSIQTEMTVQHIRN